MPPEASIDEVRAAYKEAIRVLNEVCDEFEDAEIVAEAEAGLSAARRASCRNAAR